MLCNSLYIFHAIIKTREDFMNTITFYQKQIISSKNIFFGKKKIFIAKIKVNMEKKMLLKMDEIYITETYKKLRSYLN